MELTLEREARKGKKKMKRWKGRLISISVVGGPWYAKKGRSENSVSTPSGRTYPGVFNQQQS